MTRPLLAAALLALATACAGTPETGAGSSGAPNPDLPPADPSREPVEAPPSDPFAAARAANFAAWEQDRERLAADAEAVGRWVVYVGGAFRGAWGELDDAWRATEGAQHALLFRPGVDDRDVVFGLSPFQNHDPRWTQLGTRLWGRFGLTIEAAGNVWHRREGDRTLTRAWGDADARAELVAVDGSRSVATATVPSGIFDQDLSLTEDQAEALQLGRVEAPGGAWYGSAQWPCRKVVLRVRIPELEIDAPAVGFVLPRTLTDRAALQMSPPGTGASSHH